MNSATSAALGASAAAPSASFAAPQSAPLGTPQSASPGALSLSQLIAPLLTYVGQLAQFKAADFEPSLDEVITRLDEHFSAITTQVNADAGLKTRWEEIKKPVIFFIDYMIKEGGYSFSQQYQPMARFVNELSGDDKFFDLLKLELNRTPPNPEVLRVYYELLGLGFNGAYQREPQYCAELMGKIAPLIALPELTTSELTHFSPLTPSPQGRRFHARLKRLYVGLIVLLIVSFGACLTQLYLNTKQFSSSVEAAAQAALQNVGLLPQEAEPPQQP